MKLYTEEQVKKAISIAEYGDYECEQIIDELTPIELPSDEEIEEYLQKTHTKAVNPLNVYYRTGFEKGAKWMKEQILKQNK
jgi:hypothetical protein